MRHFRKYCGLTVILGFAVFIAACRDASQIAGEESLDLEETSKIEPILGSWDSGNDTGVTLFMDGGKYYRVYRSGEGEWDAYYGSWAKVESQKIYSYAVDDSAFGGSKESLVTVWRDTFPDQPGTRLVEGAVYEFIAENSVPGSDKNTQFAYVKETDRITVSHGDYSTGMVRIKSIDDNGG
jgi:hypothetical protein